MTLLSLLALTSATLVGLLFLPRREEKPIKIRRDDDREYRRK